MFVITSLVLLWYTSSASTPIYIGLLVNTFNDDKSGNKNGQQELQAMLMGLKDVNLGPNYHMEFVLSNAHDHFDAAQETYSMVTSAFGGKGVHSTISGLPDKESLITLQMLEGKLIYFLSPLLLLIIMFINY